MASLIRVITGDRWAFEYNEPESPFKANPLYDLRTDDDYLSVFELNTERTNLEDILMGYASSKHGLGKLQYVELIQDEIVALGLEVINSPEDGKTAVANANNVHKNIKIQTADALITFAKYIYTKTTEIQTCGARKVRRLLDQGIQDGRIDALKLSCELKNVLNIV